MRILTILSVILLFTGVALIPINIGASVGVFALALVISLANKGDDYDE